MFSKIRILSTLAAGLIALLLALTTGSQAAAASPPETGIYPINRVFYQDNSWRLTLTSITVAGSQMLANMTYENLTSNPLELHCPENAGNHISTDGNRFNETLSYCSDPDRRGTTFQVKGGAKLDIWGMFPKIEDGTKTFSLTWYNWGTLTNISLTKPDKGNLVDQFLDWLNSCVEGRMDFDSGCRDAAVDLAGINFDPVSVSTCLADGIETKISPDFLNLFSFAWCAGANTVGATTKMINAINTWIVNSRPAS